MSLCKLLARAPPAAAAPPGYRPRCSAVIRAMALPPAKVETLDTSLQVLEGRQAPRYVLFTGLARTSSIITVW